jgi:carbamoylphosphate synthase large subunit
MQDQISYPVIVQVAYMDGRTAELSVARNEEELDVLVKTVISSNSQAYCYSLFQFVGRKLLTRQWVDVPYDSDGGTNNG